MTLLTRQGSRAEEGAFNNDQCGHPTQSTPAPAVSTDVADWLYSMYEDVFEAVFGSKLGNYSCPFVYVGGRKSLPPTDISGLGSIGIWETILVTKY
jgi:hypothetical protein